MNSTMQQLLQLDAEIKAITAEMEEIYKKRYAKNISAYKTRKYKRRKLIKDFKDKMQSLTNQTEPAPIKLTVGNYFKYNTL